MHLIIGHQILLMVVIQIIQIIEGQTVELSIAIKSKNKIIIITILNHITCL